MISQKRELVIFSNIPFIVLSRWCHQPGWQTADSPTHARSLSRQYMPSWPREQTAFQWGCSVWWCHDWLAALQSCEGLHQQLWTPGGSRGQWTGNDEKKKKQRTTKSMNSSYTEFNLYFLGWSSTSRALQYLWCKAAPPDCDCIYQQSRNMSCKALHICLEYSSWSGSASFQPT